MLTNSLGNSASSSLANFARNVTVPVLVAIWLLSAYSVPVAISLVVVAGVRGDRQLRARIDALDHLAEIVLGDGEFHRGRLHGGDDHDAGRARGGDVIARIDEPQADPARDGRGDAAINEIELELGDIGLVGFDLGLVLLDRGIPGRSPSARRSPFGRAAAHSGARSERAWSSEA